MMQAPTNGRESVLYNNLTEKELDAMRVMRRMLVDARLRKAIGKLSLEMDYAEGGITALFVGTRYKEPIK